MPLRSRSLNKPPCVGSIGRVFGPHGLPSSSQMFLMLQYRTYLVRWKRWARARWKRWQAQHRLLRVAALNDSAELHWRSMGDFSPRTKQQPCQNQYFLRLGLLPRLAQASFSQLISAERYSMKCG